MTFLQIASLIGRIPRPRFPQSLRFRQNRDRALLLRIAHLIHGRLDVIEMDWSEAIEDYKESGPYCDAKLRSRRHLEQDVPQRH